MMNHPNLERQLYRKGVIIESKLMWILRRREEAAIMYSQNQCLL